MVSFTVQKLLSLIRSHLFIFAFVSIALGNWPKKTMVQFMSENVLAASSRNVMVSCLKTFWVSSCVVWGCVKTSLIYMWLSSFPNTACWRDCIIPLHSLTSSCQRLTDSRCTVYFWGLYSVPLTHVCFCANATLFWFLWLYSYAWSLGGLCLLLCFF